MLKFSKNDEIDTDKYESRLRKDGYIAYDRAKMESVYEYESVNFKTLAGLATDVMIHNSAWRFTTVSSSDPVLNYLMDCEHCPEYYFVNRKTKGYSLDTKKVLNKLRDNGYATEFIDLYTAFKSKKLRCGKVRNVIDSNLQPLGKNKDGADIHAINFAVQQQKNLRYNYSNTDIIAIPKEYNDCITVEDGFFLAWGDFAQSDFRIAYNLFIRSPENDLIMGQYDDKYEALARIVTKAEGKAFDLEQFKKDRPLYKQLTLATIYGTRSSVVPEEAAFITRFYEFLKGCPKYVEYEKRLYARAKLNVPIIVKSYFGHTESCPIAYKIEDTVHNALNSPVQSCTSEIVILTVNTILDMFYEKGYSEDDISVYYVRHDEPIFKIREAVLNDIWILNQAFEILVDNWSPLAMDFNFGYYYKQSDDDLEKKVQEIYQNNEDKIDRFEMGTAIDTEYYPVAPILNLSCAKEVTADGKTVLCLYDGSENKVAYYLCHSTDDEEVYEFMQKSIATKEEFIYSAGYRGINVLSNFMEGEVFYGGSLIKFSKVDNGDTIAVAKFCRYMTLKYCRSNNVETDLLPPYAEDEELITTAKELF